MILGARLRARFVPPLLLEKLPDISDIEILAGRL
jgi:hypothetical protein